MKNASLRAEKGVIEVELATKENSIVEIKITGDFFIYPEEAIEDIEEILLGCSTSEEEIKTRIDRLYQQKSLSTPGISIDDWVKVVTMAITK